MSIQIVGADEGLVTLKITGKITPMEQQEFQRKVAAIIPSGEKRNVLVLADDFQGWDKGDWGNIGYQSEFDAHVRKMAIVGDKKWHDLGILFTGKGFRSIEIEMFGSPDQARAWLTA